MAIPRAFLLRNGHIFFDVKSGTIVGLMQEFRNF